MISYGCISANPLGSTANWWERSPNANNSNNFCNVNTNGNANNNNANNSLGVAPDFITTGLQTVTFVNYDPYERRNTSRGESPKQKRASRPIL